ncbi:class I SAM-dependent methyltransferase [Rhodopseudomonas sp. B29]|uniref:class I SAM-dependent methyltransferase n=1 Tax=Rhodopseudomonas sp. B29 TaxID=95607 RepID=UPI00034BA721|nr:class I SAM-dependent methyltransferase [Rhodopseudomonas sp. B29]
MNTPPTTKNRLAEIFLAHDGKLTDKWEQYFPIYAGELARYVDSGTPVRLLEVGVQNGGSLEVWSKYLPAGSHIVGVDIDPLVGNLTFEGNVRAHVADINDTDRVDSLIGGEPFDVIVDDGSHTSSDIIATFRRLFPRLAPGGKFIIEDLHASYWKSHEGGLRLKTSSIEYFKGLVDAVNADYIDKSENLSADEKSELQEFGRQIARISFYDSVAVVEKLAQDKKGPYRHVLSGQLAAVNDPTEFIINAPSSLVSSWILSEVAARSIDLKLKEAAQRARQEAAEAQRARQRSEDEYNRCQKMLVELERRSSELTQDLHQALSQRDAAMAKPTAVVVGWLRRIARLVRK